MPPIHAIYEDGVFKPVTPVDLPERCEVEFQPRVVTPNGEVNLSAEGMDEIYELLDRRYNSGVADTAERHNEHQS